MSQTIPVTLGYLMARKEVDPNSGCWNWTQWKTEKGYGAFNVKRLRKNFRAHRVMWMIVKGPIPKDYFICHKCDNPSCINPEHLFLGTADENTLDMVLKGRSTSKLTKEQVHIIASSNARGVDLANEFGVTQTVISSIRHRRSWVWLTSKQKD